MEGPPPVSFEHQYRTKPIPIKKSKTQLIQTNTQTEYSLKQNFFDPTKSSPPDNFMEKLELRMQEYYMEHAACKILVKRSMA